MKTLTNLAFIYLIGLAFSPTNGEEKTIISKNVFIQDQVKYSGSHEIVSLLVPLNSLNFDRSDSSESDSQSHESEYDADNIIVFFVEADIDSEGKYIDQGLYVLKKGKATKILDHGRDAAASSDNSEEVFFGAADGIYSYNKDKNSAEKYGTVNDSIIGIAKESTGDVIYILTENHEVYKVSNKGTTKEKLNDIVNAKQIVLDTSDNLYFYSDDKKPYVRTHGVIKKIEGLPANPNSVTLTKQPFMVENAVGFLVDNVGYILFANGTSLYAEFEFEPNAKPSAFAPEASILQYYALDKKIYVIDIRALSKNNVTENLKKYINQKSANIKSSAKKSFRLKSGNTF